jgi:hypothetical protein
LLALLMQTLLGHRAALLRLLDFHVWAFGPHLLLFQLRLLALGLLRVRLLLHRLGPYCLWF